MKKLCLIMALLTLCFLIFADMAEYYSFSSTTATYTSITGTQISELTSDDVLSPAIAIGFPFPYGDANVENVMVSSNGWVGLGTTFTHSNLSNDLSSTEWREVLAILWDDTSLNGGTAETLLSGSAPNRVFTVQYNNLRWNYSGGTSINMQVKLHESGKIQFCYGPMTGTINNPSASIGINMNPGGSGWFYSITPGTPALYSDTNSNNSITEYPGEGVVYEFIPSVAQPNDMAAVSVTGNTTPSVNSATTYNVTVRNRGTSAQSAYTVQLIDAANSVLASATGVALAAGATHVFPLSWTPTVEGPVQLRGKVVLPGDQNPQNDISQPFSVTVMPEGLAVITIGDGSMMDRLPVDMYFRNSLFETIYYPQEINMFGTISALTFYNNFVTDLPNKPVKIWMGTTADNDLSGGWIPSTDLTLVFDSTVNFPIGANNILIPLSTPFTYAGGNLVVLVNRPFDAGWFDSSNVFQCQNGTQLRSLRDYSDSTELDPANPPTGTAASLGFPRTSIHMTPLSDDPIVMVAPDPLDFPQTLMDQSMTRNMTIMNGGGGTAVISSVSLSGSPFFTITNPPTLPISLTTGQYIPLTVQYAPTAAGNHTAVLTVVDDTTRLTHSVNITGSCMDPYIYSLPYVQNFDTVSVPAIPLDWSKLVNTTSQWAYVRTQNSIYHSAQNAVEMYNSEDTAANLFIIAPPLDDSIDITNTRVSFFARSSNTASELIVGVMTSPTDAASFTPVSTVTLGLTFAEYILSFSAYTGTGRFIAFKHPQTSSYVSNYLDTVMLEISPENDLAALSLSGNTTPSVNMNSTYTVRIVNRGSLTQNLYQVALYNAANDVELATAPGLSVAPDMIVEVPIQWTPTVEGPLAVYAKVILAGDQNALNDQCAPINITVFPENIMATTIGSGDQLNRIPMDFFYRNSLFETLYYPDEMMAFGNITSVSIYNNFVTNLTNMPVKIWMGSTTQDNLSAGWIPATELTLVFDGNVNFPMGENTIIFPLQTPVTYAGGNLVLLMERPMDGTYYSSQDRFRSQTGTQLRSLNVYSDGTDYDPAAPPTGVNPIGVYPMITFHMTPLSDDPVFLAVPSTWDYDTVLLNTVHDKQIRVMNVGGGNLGVNSVNISGSPFISLLDLPTLPASLATGQMITFTVRYNPTAVGEHDAVITITDDQAVTRRVGSRSSRIAHTVTIAGECIDPTITTLPYLQTFDAVSEPAIPIQWSSIIGAGSPGTIGTAASDAFTAPNHAFLYNQDNNALPLILIAPPYATDIQTNTTRVKFYGMSYSNGATVDLGVMTNPQDPASFTLIQSITLNTVWTEHVVSFGAYTGAGKHIAFRHGNTGTYQRIMLDNVMLEVNPQNDLAVLAITGNSTPTVNYPNTYQVTVYNWGSLPQSDYQIKLFGAQNQELASIAGAPITPGQALPHDIIWSPAAEGPTFIYAKVVMAGDQNPLNDEGPHFNVTVQPEGVYVLTVGEGNELGRIPMDMFYMNSLYECIYYPADLSNTLGMIMGLGFHNNFENTLSQMPVNIWMGTTTLEDLSAGYIPSTSLTPVFSGLVDFPSGENLIHIPFAQPFFYLDGGNLVVMVERPMDTQYYSSQDRFKTQTGTALRSINNFSDGTDFDPASPPTGNATGTFPKTSFYIIPGGVGHMQGVVTGENNQALADVNVDFTSGGYHTTTNAAGEYGIINIVADDYTVNFSHYGYISQTHDVSIPEDVTVTLNVNLLPMPTVTVSGSIVASDTGSALAGAMIHLSGYQNYTVNSTATGSFTIPAVYANQSYEYTIICPGYTNMNGIIEVATANYNMGTITMNEIAYAPHNVQAQLNDTFDAINLSWEVPDPTAIEITESFEAPEFPPLNWQRIVTNNGPVNSSGVYPTWCRFGSTMIGGETVAPTDGSFQAGLWWDYNHQDEWLITPSFNCPSEAYITFDSYVFLGSENNDHYLIRASSDAGITWTTLWDASTQTGGWNYYDSSITVDLSAYAGIEISLAMHADDPPSNDGLWYTWFVDNVYIGNALTSVSFDGPIRNRSRSVMPGIASISRTPDQPSRAMANGWMRKEQCLPKRGTGRSRALDQRVLTGYNVHRLLAGQEANQALWTQVNDEMINIPEAIDESWTDLPNGTYRWAITAVYTAGVNSAPAFSNAVVREQLYGTIVGFVRRSNNQGIAGAIVSSGDYSATTNNAGAYSLYLPAGLHDVTATAPGFNPLAMNQINVIPNQNITINFVLIPTSNEDDLNPVVATTLKGNIPNPFNPSTTILYDILLPCPVRLDIYNARGQKVRSLIDEWKASGHHSVVWDGRDDAGRATSSGVYFYRFTARDYSSTRKMLLME